MKIFFYRLFFTRDDDLDLLQVFFLAAILFFGVAFVMEAKGAWTPSATAWRMFERIFYLLAFLGVPMWATKLILRYVGRDNEPDDADGDSGEVGG